MKKSLSAILATSMAFSMFASAAFAADATTTITTEAKFQEMKTAGIFQGINGESHLDQLMTRAEFAKALATLLKLESKPAAAASFKDVTATHWAIGQIGALAEAKIIEGVAAGQFGPKVNVSLEQVAKIAVTALKLEVKDDAKVEGKTSAWATKYVAAAVAAGLIKTSADYTKNATRGDLVDASFVVYQNTNVAVKGDAKVIDDKNIEVTFTDGGVVKKTLDTALKTGETTKVSVEYKGKTYEVSVKLDALKATGAKQTGAKKITVDFNQPVLSSDKTVLTYELKFGLQTYAVTPKYADDNKSVVLEAAYLPAGDFTLTVKGSDAIKLKVEAEKATKIDIAAPALTFADDVELGVKTFNQFNEEMKTVSPSVTVYNVTKNKSISVESVNGGRVDLKTPADTAAIGDSITIMAVIPSVGLSQNKTVKVINGSAATSIKIDAVKPLTGKDRVSINETGLVLPLTLTDASGQAVKLPAVTKTLDATSFELGGLFFFVSDIEIIKYIAVDANGVVTFNTGAKSGTAFVTITNGATQATASTSIVVNGAATVKDLQISHPGKEIVKGEDIAFPFTAIDTFGATIKGKDLDLSKVTFAANGATVKVNAKGELIFNFPNTGDTTIYTYVNGLQQPNPVQINVKDVAKYTAVSGIKDVATTYEVGASNDFDQDNILLVDSYGRSSNVAEGKFTVTSDKEGIVKYEGGKLVAVAAGSATITVASTANADNVANKITNYSFTVNVVASDDIKSYAIDTVGTVYGKAFTAAEAAKKVAYTKSIKLVGKTASQTVVALKDNTAPFVTSSDQSVLEVVGTNQVSGIKAGKSTITVIKNGEQIATQEVTVSEELPVAKTVEFEKDEYTIAAVNGTATIKVTVKDQYGVVVSPLNQVASSDTAVASVTDITPNGDGTFNVTVKGLKKGSVVLTFTSSNLVTDTTTVVVNG
ncbi:S-layer homology domain-containing protein [Paenibacillus aurantiacus]|uniref:S-layer homology domain-containing protein n=1 Tax=Paenibacillus aurantiacus TaxID=1936118 RepID=A0ABV5KP89_9BACL